MPIRAHRAAIELVLLALISSVPSLAGEAAAPAAPAGSSPDQGGPFERLSAELPPWLKLGAEIRGRIDNYFGLNSGPGRDNSYYRSDRVRVGRALGDRTQVPGLRRFRTFGAGIQLRYG